MLWKNSFDFKREMILYTISGAVTTATNFGVYFLLRYCMEPTPSAAVAWVLSVVVSYAMNAGMVFPEKNLGLHGHAVQFARFILSRALSGALEIFGAYYFIDKMNCSELTVKIYIGISVTVLNYVFCKLIVFNEK